MITGLRVDEGLNGTCYIHEKPIGKIVMVHQEYVNVRIEGQAYFLGGGIMFSPGAVIRFVTDTTKDINPDTEQWCERWERR